MLDLTFARTNDNHGKRHPWENPQSLFLVVHDIDHMAHSESYVMVSGTDMMPSNGEGCEKTEESDRYNMRRVYDLGFSCT